MSGQRRAVIDTQQSEEESSAGYIRGVQATWRGGRGGAQWRHADQYVERGHAGRTATVADH